MKAFALGMLFAVGLGSPAAAQIESGGAEVVHPNQRVTVPDLAAVAAADASRTAVAKAALAIALSAAKVKCEPGSQLDDALAGAGPSLQSLSDKVAETTCVINGRAQRVAASFTPNGAIQADSVIASVMESRPLLVEWKNELYVLYGVVYDEHRHSDGRRVNVIRELLLIDPRYSDKRRLVAFDRGKDNFADVEGMASVGVGRR